MAAFEVDRRDLAERGVPPARVVEALDEVEDGHLRLGLRLEAFAVEKLALERREEALAERVVVSVTDGAHRGPDTGLLASQPEGDRRVLGEFQEVVATPQERGGVAMAASKRRRSDRALRPPMGSPGRPPLGRREHRQRFWEEVARGLSSE